MFRVYFNQNDLQRLIFATHKEESQAELQVHDMQRRCAVDFLMLLRRNILTNRHTGNYDSLSSDYRKWKKDHGKMGMGFWKLFGDLFRSLQTSKIGRQSRWRAGYFAGVPRGARDSGGKSWYGKGDKGASKSIEQIGTWMEEGRTGQPARPIFGPTTEGYIKSGAWTKRGVQSLDKMKWSWS